jgi:hypothetical protein
VSARHVIKQIENSGDGNVYLRVNLKPGETWGDDGPNWVVTPVVDWKFHPSDDRIDVAVMQLPNWGSSLDHKIYPTRGFVTPERRQKRDIGVGDELYFPGLFVKHYGRTNNVPIVRFGSISAIPGEPAWTKLGYSSVYLAETRSIGGLSGSPVFVYIPSDRDAQKGPIGEKTYIPLGGGDSFLIGLVHGHWDADVAGDAAAETDFSLEKDLGVNMGVGVIVPSEAILDAINQPCFSESREQQKLAKRRSNAPTMD